MCDRLYRGKAVASRPMLSTWARRARGLVSNALTSYITPTIVLRPDNLIGRVSFIGTRPQNQHFMHFLGVWRLGAATIRLATCETIGVGNSHSSIYCFFCVQPRQCHYLHWHAIWLVVHLGVRIPGASGSV